MTTRLEAKAMAACRGKKVYLTPTHARHDARDMRRFKSQRVQAYRCDLCKFWHVGTTHE